MTTSRIFTYCGLFLERNPRDKRKNAAYIYMYVYTYYIYSERINVVKPTLVLHKY